MGESLGSRPEELYAEHKSTTERLDEMQKRLDAARVLSDILTPEQISQLGSADFDAKMQHENNLKEATQHYQENQDAYVEQAKEEMQERGINQNNFEPAMQEQKYQESSGEIAPAVNNETAIGGEELSTSEIKTAQAKAQIEAMLQWLRQNDEFSREIYTTKIDRLTVGYDEKTEQAVVSGRIDLAGLTSAKGLVLPRVFNGSINLGQLETSEGLTLPESMGADENGNGLNLNSLVSAEGLVLPRAIGGGLSLDGLKSAKGLVLPDSVGGLSLTGLTSAEGLVLPRSVGFPIRLDGLTSAERNAIRAQRPDLAVKIFPKD